MTSIVTIKAHCAPSKRVQVIVKDTNIPTFKDEFYLESGETAERAIWDGRSVTTQEVLK